MGARGSEREVHTAKAAASGRACGYMTYMNRSSLCGTADMAPIHRCRELTRVRSPNWYRRLDANDATNSA